MKVMVKNLGPLKQAEFTLGDLTIICGKNNTGKTYATYALYGFLELWKEETVVNVGAKRIQRLLSEGSIEIDIEALAKDAQKILDRACLRYSKRLAQVFASQENLLKDSSFRVIIENGDLKIKKDFKRSSGTTKNQLFSIERKGVSPFVVVSLLVEKESIKIPVDFIARMIGDALKDLLFDLTFPEPYISSTERTGAAIFRKELDFARNRLLEEMAKQENGINPLDLLFKSFSRYALPVTLNVDFTRRLEDIVKKESYIAQNHREIIGDFSELLGGQFIVKKGLLFFSPKKSNIRLTMNESSSAVKSLLDIGFYLKHEAQKGDLLIVDEPELNLHPENQRRLARLFVRLVNAGIKVFITTHSDYFIREFNTMIMLNQNDDKLKKIADKEGYRQDELLDSKRIRAYIADFKLVEIEGHARRSRGWTFSSAEVEPTYGIEMRSFDDTIDDMNRIQDEIVYGA